MSTATSVLVRAPFKPFQAPEFWNTELLAEARTLLGYAPRVDSRDAQLVREKNEATLARALESCGIQPFTVESVRKYQEKKVQTALQNRASTFVQYMHRSGDVNDWGRKEPGRGQRVVFHTGLWAALSSAIGLIVTFGLINAHVPFLRAAPWTLSTGALLWAIWGVCMYARHKKALAIRAAWVSRLISGGQYTEAIPDFAIARMISLKKELPETAFYVEEMQTEKLQLQTDRNPRPLPPPRPDPFLLVEYKGRRAYIDVWDEPKFEGRRTV